MNDSNTQPQTSTLNGSRLVMAGLVIAFLGFALWSFYAMRSQRAQSDDALARVLSDNESLRKQMANLQTTVSDTNTAELYRQEQQTLAKNRIRSTLSRVEKIKKSAFDIANLQSQWTTAVEQLKASPEGREIASDPGVVDLLAAVLETAPASDVSQTLLRQLEPLSEQAQAALDQELNTFEPTQDYLAQIEQLENSTLDTTRWYQDHLLQLSTLTTQVARTQPSQDSLAEALRTREAELAQERVETLAERTREIQQQREKILGEAEREAQRIIAEAQAEAKRTVSDTTANLIRQSAAEEKAKQDEEIRRRQHAEKLAQLNRDFQRDMPGIQAKLQPFLSTGYTYNGDSGRKGPVSLGVLRSQGALEPGRRGLERLLYVGGTTTNDRNRGAFPQYIGGEWGWRQTNKDFLVQAQDYLIRYGDLLVEAGMLAN